MIQAAGHQAGVPLFPDTALTYSGTVTSARRREGEGIVEVELRATTGLGDHVTGVATLSLPLGPPSAHPPPTKG